jgi:hypothetical protein
MKYSKTTSSNTFKCSKIKVYALKWVKTYGLIHNAVFVRRKQTKTGFKSRTDTIRKDQDITSCLPRITSWSFLVLDKYVKVSYECNYKQFLWGN